MKSQNQKVAYIIVGWNNQSLLKECIESIQGQTHKNKEIIYVDNASSDGSAEFVKKNFSVVQVMEMTDNYGFAKGNNIGIRKAFEDEDVAYIALLNTDATLDPDWATTILNTAAYKPKGASFQTITLDYYDHETIDSTHIYVSHNGQATQGSHRRAMLADSDVAPQRVFGCNAAAVIYSRAFIEAQPFQDFFDQTMFMYLEDVDVAARATVMGWDNYVVPGSRAYHMGSASSGKNPGFSLYLTFRNNSGMLIKNFPLVILIKIFPKLVRGDIATIKTLWRTSRKNQIKHIFKGRFVGLLYAPIYLKKRAKIEKRNSVHLLWRLMHRGF